MYQKKVINPKINIMKSFKPITAYQIDSNDFMNFISEVIGNDVELLESPNDTDYNQNVDADFEKKYFDIDEINEVTEKFKSGGIENYYMSNIFSWLYYYGYIPAGDYSVSVSW